MGIRGEKAEENVEIKVRRLERELDGGNGEIGRIRKKIL